MPSISMGFCVARTKNGLSRMRLWPATVTCFSCIASSRAACVLGGVRLISSARMRLAKIGPRLKTSSRRPSAVSSRISVPVMSEGIRSGVNWMRLKERSKTFASVLTSSVFASPGAPVTRQWPPASRAISIWSTTSSCPMMTLRSSLPMISRAEASFPAISSSRSGVGAEAISERGESSLISGSRKVAGTAPRGKQKMRPDGAGWQERFFSRRLCRELAKLRYFPPLPGWTQRIGAGTTVKTRCKIFIRA